MLDTAAGLRERGHDARLIARPGSVLAASAPARAYVDASRRLMGEEVAMVVPAERKGFMDRLLGRRAA